MKINDTINKLNLRIEPLAYEGFYSGKPILKNWLSFDGNKDDAWLFSTVTVLDTSALGTGAPPITIRTSLALDNIGRPLRYTSKAGKNILSINFTGDQIKAILPDESTQIIEGPRPDAILENNNPGQIALLLALLRPTETGTVKSTLQVLLSSSLTCVSYNLSAKKDCLHSNLGESMHVTDNDILMDLYSEDGEMTISRLTYPPPIPLDSQDTIHEIKYIPPKNANFLSSEIEIEGVYDSIFATLTQPQDAAPLGKVLMIQGSGDVDRHGISGNIDTGTHEIADTLASSGFAVLRYDKRGVGHSPTGNNTLGAGYMETVEDARRCLDRLANEINEGKLFLVGHSLGSLTALILSTEFFQGNLPLILLAPPGRKLDDLMRDQIYSQGKRLGLKTKSIEMQVKKLQAFIAYTEESTDETDVEIPAEIQAGRMKRRLYSELISRDPAVIITQQKAPVLICQGGKDIQVHPIHDAKRLFEAAKGAGIDVELAYFESLNHIFKTAPDDEGLKGYYETRSVASELIKTVQDWALQHA